VNLTNGTPATGTLGATSVTINAGQNSASTTFQPVAAGTSAISINGTPSGYTTPSNDQSTTFTVTAPNAGFYNPGVCPWGETATTFSENVGLNEQSGCYFEPYLFTAAPAGGRTVTVTVSDPTKLLLTTNASQVGSGTITQNILAGSSFGQAIYMQGLASSGTVTITETVSGYNTATATITLIPTGFIVTGGTTTTTFSTASNVNVYFAELNATTLNYYTSAYLRPGAASVTVNLTNGTPATGTLGATSVTINAGQNSASTTFQPVAAGTSAISINGTPRGYTTPSNDQSTTFTVTAPNAGFAGAGSCPWGGTATTFSQNVGLNEQSGCYFYPYLFTAAPTGGRTVTLTVSDPTKLLLTTNTSQVGAGTITQNLAVGASEGQAIYMQGLASSGTVTITETVSGYNTATATITLIPTGFIISGGTTTTTFSGTSSVSVLFAELNPTTLSYSSTLAYLSPGATAVTVNIANDTPATGTLGATSVTINPGQDSSYTTFLPVAAGTANIRITATPSGYTTPGNDQVTTFTVTEPSSGVTAVTVGKNLQSTTYGTLGVGAPSGGITVLLTSADSTKVLLSKSATTVGTASISYNLTSGQSQTPSFYVQAIGNPGTAQNPVTVAIMISAPGVANGSGNVTIVPSGFVFQTSNFTTHVTDTATTLTIVPSALDPTYLTSTAVQQIQPGLTNIPAMVTLTDQSGTSPVGSITVNPVTFNGADSPNSRTTSFQPLNVGSTLLGLTSPGFTTSSSQVTATVIQ
jgi:hypothetical protein